MVASTLAVLSANDTHASTEHKEHPGHENAPDVVKPIKPFQLPREPIKKSDLYKDGDADGGGGGGAGDGNMDSKGEMEANIHPVKDSIEQDKKSANEIRGVEKSLEKPKVKSPDGGKNGNKRTKLNDSQIENNGAVLRGAHGLKDAVLKESADLMKRKMAMVTSREVTAGKGADRELIRDKKTIADLGGDDKKPEIENSIKSRKIKTLLEHVQIKGDGPKMSRRTESEHISKNISNFVSVKRNEKIAAGNNSVDRQAANVRSDARNNI